MAVDAAGVVYAGTSPDGKVYRIQGGKATEVFAPKAKYIWSLAFGKDGALYVGTGEPGNVYRIDQERARPSFTTRPGRTNVTSLAVDADGRVLAGSEPNGILYRISAKDKAFVLYDANLPEIRSVVADPGWHHLRGGPGRIAGQPLRPDGESAGLHRLRYGDGAFDDHHGHRLGLRASRTGDQTQSRYHDPRRPDRGGGQYTDAGGPLVEVSGVERSALYKINPDSTVETLWSSKDENVYDLVAHSNGELYFSTDMQGRIYRLNADRKPSLIVQTTEGEATRLLESKAGLLAATADMGKLFRLEDSASPSGTYESPVHDSGTVARWGRISWRSPAGVSQAGDPHRQLRAARQDVERLVPAPLPIRTGR